MSIYNVILSDNYDDYFEDIRLFCKQAICEMTEGKQKRDVKQTIKNMNYINWENNIHCLLYRLYIKQDFSNGNGIFCLIYDDDKIISVSGVSKYSNDIALIARRKYILTPYRAKGLYHKYSLDSQIKWSKENKFKACIITINEYNISVYKLLERIINKRWIERFPKFESFILLGGPYKINNTKQYIVLYKLDKNFNEKEIEWEI